MSAPSIKTVVIGTPGPPGSGITSADYAALTQANDPTIYNIASAGAIGSGDDTAVFQAAIDAAFARGGGVVALPPGTYTTGQLTLRAGVLVRGAGRDVTTLKLKNGANSHQIVGTNAHRAGVEALTFDGNATNQVGTMQWNGLFLTTSDHLVVRDVRFVNQNGLGLALAGCQQGRVIACRAESTGHAGFWFGTSGATHCWGTEAVACSAALTYYDGFILDSDQVAVLGAWVDQTGQVRFTDSGTGASGIYVGDNRRDVRVVGCHVQSTTGHGIDLSWGNTDASYDNVVAGNTCLANHDSGIATASNGTVVAGNACRNNGQGGTGDSAGILVDAANCVVTGNRCTDTQTTKTQAYGLYLRNNSGVTDQLTALGNDIAGNISAGIANLTTTGANHQILANRGQPNYLIDHLRLPLFAALRALDPTGTADRSLVFLDSSDAMQLRDGNVTIDASGRMGFNSPITATTIGAAGGASALPATPKGYVTILIAGTPYKVPYYNP